MNLPKRDVKEFKDKKMYYRGNGNQSTDIIIGRQDTSLPDTLDIDIPETEFSVDGKRIGVQVDLIANLAALDPNNLAGRTVSVAGGTAVGDGDGGRYYFYATGLSGVTPDGSNVIASTHADSPDGYFKRTSSSSKTTCVDTVTALLALKNVKDGTCLETDGYSTFGVGANSYQYDESSTATIDGGFVLPGSEGVMSLDASGTFNGTAGTGRWIAVDQIVARPEQFGALGDGSTNDSPAIQAAINTGRVVSLRLATYRVQNLSPSNGVLQMNGHGSTLQSIAVGSQSAIDLDVSQDTVVELEEIALTGYSTAVLAPSTVTHSVKLTATGVTVSGCQRGIGLLSDTCTAIVRASKFEDIVATTATTPAYGIAVGDLVTPSSNSGTIVADCEFENIDSGSYHESHAIWLTGQDGVVERCKILDVTGSTVGDGAEAIYIDGSGFQIRHNRITNGGHGQGSITIKAAGNRVSHNEIKVDGSTASCGIYVGRQSLIEYNEISGLAWQSGSYLSGCGIYLNSADMSGTRIVRNELTDLATRYGIYSQGYGSDIEIADNAVTGQVGSAADTSWSIPMYLVPNGNVNRFQVRNNTLESADVVLSPGGTKHCLNLALKAGTTNANVSIVGNSIKSATQSGKTTIAGQLVLSAADVDLVRVEHNSFSGTANTIYRTVATSGDHTNVLVNANSWDAPATLKADDVNDLLALIVSDGQKAETRGYSAAGIGANSYVYDADSTATIDGGFVLPGVGGVMSLDASGVFDGTAGTGRWLATKTDVANVDQFGALGDGGTDDTRPCMAALKHTDIKFRRGTYNLATWSEQTTLADLRITMDEGATLAGDASSTFVRLTEGHDLEIKGGGFSTWDTVVLLGAATVTHKSIVIERVTIDAVQRGVSDTGGQAGVEFLRVADCVFDSVSEFAILVRTDKMDLCDVTRNRFTNIGGNPAVSSSAIHVSDANGGESGTINITKNWIDGVTNPTSTIDVHGILVRGRGFHVEKNYIANVSAGVGATDDEAIYTTGEHGTISDNVIVNCSHGEGTIVAKGNGPVEIDRNKIISNDGSLREAAISSLAPNTVCRGNIIEGLERGIVFARDHSIATGNIITIDHDAVTNIGIDFATVNDCIASNNVLHLNGQSLAGAWAFRVQGNSSRNIIRDNQVTFKEEQYKLHYDNGTGVLPGVGDVVTNTTQTGSATIVEVLAGATPSDGDFRVTFTGDFANNDNLSAPGWTGQLQASGILDGTLNTFCRMQMAGGETQSDLTITGNKANDTTYVVNYDGTGTLSPVKWGRNDIEMSGSSMTGSLGRSKLVTIDNGLVGSIDYAASDALSVGVPAKLNGVNSAVSCTLADGTWIGQRQNVQATNVANAVTVTVANHSAGVNKVITFVNTSSVIQLEWNGDVWDEVRTETGGICDAYVSTAAASNSITATTYLNVLTNATIADAGETSTDWTIDDTNDRVTYSGPDIVAKVCIPFSCTTSRSNVVASFRLAKNGTTKASTQIDRKIGTGSDVGAAVVVGTFALTSGDYIELHGTLASSSSDTITIEYASIVITE